MMKVYQFLAASVFVLCTDTAFACENQPDISQLPGETPKDASERFEKAFADQGVIRAYERESFGLKSASMVYIAKVVKSNRGSWAFGSERPILPSVTVQPMEAIKGSLPQSNRELATTGLTSCGERGDGEATTAHVGTLVIVFEGLPKSEWLPNGIDSIRATSARTFELLDPLFRYGTPIANPWNK